LPFDFAFVLFHARRHRHRRAFTDNVAWDGARTVQELLGHKGVETTMLYTHVLNRGGRVVASPLDRLRKPMGVESGRIMRTDLSHKTAQAGG
jgi:integrase